jgi:predicted choloylglycine hydrolase
MKKNWTIFNGLLAAVVSLMLMTGCSDENSTSSVSTGKVIQSPVAGATVFLDINGNRVFDEGEPNTKTDANGSYTLNIPDGKEGLICSVGGTVTGKGTEALPMLAPRDAGNITAITTLVAINPGLKATFGPRWNSDPYEVIEKKEPDGTITRYVDGSLLQVKFVIEALQSALALSQASNYEQFTAMSLLAGKLSDKNIEYDSDVKDAVEDFLMDLQDSMIAKGKDFPDSKKGAIQSITDSIIDEIDDEIAEADLAGVTEKAEFRNEIRTLRSIQKIDEYGFYTMEYSVDYGFDEFLELGASNDTELIQFVMGRLMRGFPVEITETKLSCSTFNAATPDGEFVFGRNFDMGYSPSILVRTKPDDGYESISMVNLAFLGYKDDYMPDSFIDRMAALAAPYVPLDGINEKGLSVGILMLPGEPTNQETDKIDITSTTAIRLILDNAATVDEAVDLLKNYDMHDSANACYHYQIADANGKSVIIEYVDNEMQVLKAETNYQACTNFYLTPGEMYEVGDGQDRYKILMESLEKQNGILTKDAMGLLESVKMVDILDKKSGILYNTQWSAVYNNSKMSVDICIGMKYDKVYNFEIGLEKF